MRKLVYSLILAVFLCSAAFGASPSELKRMSTFLSNFTELRYYNINLATISDEELVHFGVWHNYINNFSTRIEIRPDEKNYPYKGEIIDKKYVAESVKKFFDLDLNHTSTEDEIYDGKYYHFNGADGEIVYLADVQKVSRNGKTLTLRGELYSSEDEDDRPATFTARVKPYKYKGVNTWSLISLETKMRGEM